MLFEGLHEPGEIQERPAEAVDPLDDDAVDLAGLDVGQQAGECRPVEVAAGETAVVVGVRQAGPAFGPLAGDIGLGGFALRVQRIELLVESSWVDLRV